MDAGQVRRPPRGQPLSRDVGIHPLLVDLPRVLRGSDTHHAKPIYVLDAGIRAPTKPLGMPTRHLHRPEREARGQPPVRRQGPAACHPSIQ